MWGRIIPDIICGDLDSIEPEVLEHYKSSMKTDIKRIDEQETNDLQKCLQILHKVFLKCE